jgi:ATP-dependent Clp protease adaptor protein ClpS
MSPQSLPTLNKIYAQADDSSDSQSEGHVLTRYKPKVSRPSFYRVMLLNDDFTPMDFVVHILKKFFGKDEAEAQKIMLQVHHQGMGTAGLYAKEIAETKVYQVNEYAKSNRHPLKCVMEKEPQEAGG